MAILTPKHGFGLAICTLISYQIKLKWQQDLPHFPNY